MIFNTYTHGILFLFGIAANVVVGGCTHMYARHLYRHHRVLLLLGIIALLPALIYVPVPDAHAQVSTAPTVTLAATNDAGDAITLTMSEFVTDNSAVPGDFTVSGTASNPTVSSISVSGGPVILTLSAAVAKDETITVSYTKSVSGGTIDDADGNPLEDFAGTAVANRVSGVATPLVHVSSVADTASGDFSELDGANGTATFVVGSNTYAIIASTKDYGVQIIDVTTPSSPTHVAAVADGAGGFSTLQGAGYVDTFVIGDKTYAIVTASRDNGVQIIDITTPASPTAVAAVTNGSIFTTLHHPYGVDTVVIGDKTYAVVASYLDHGIQIIDITTPASPTAVAAVTDGASYAELFGAVDVDTVVIGDKTYAVVASYEDSGVQIIDITTPASPTAVAAISDNVDGFTELGGARGVEIVVIDTKTYAIVTALGDDGVQIIDITTPSSPAPVAAVTDGAGGFTELDGAHNIETVVIDSNTYAIIASGSDDGVQVIDITTPATPTAVDDITDGQDSFAELDGALGVDTFVVDGSTYIVVTGYEDDGVQIIRFDPATPTVTAAAANAAGNAITLTMSEFVTDNSATPADFTISGAASSPTVSAISVSSNPVILTLTGGVIAKGETVTVSYTPSAGSIDDAAGNSLASFTDTAVVNRASGTGFLTPVASATDGVGGFTTLADTTRVDTFVIGDKTYAIATSQDDEGVQIIDITTPASPTAIAAATDGKNGFTELESARGIHTIVIDTKTYAIVTSITDHGVQIIDITTPATPTAVAVATDGADFTTLNRPSAVDTFVIGSNTYAIVTSHGDVGIQIIDITTPATPTAVAVATDGTDFELSRPNDVATFVIGSNTYAIVTASQGNAVQIIDITTPATPTAVATVTDGAGGFTVLDGPNQVDTFVIGDKTYAIVTAAGDILSGEGGDSVQIIDVTTPATPAHVATVTDGAGGFTELGGADAVEVFVIGASTHAIVTGYTDNAVQIIDVTTPATPTAVDTATDGAGGFTALQGPASTDTFVIDGSTYAIVASQNDNAVQIIGIDTVAPTVAAAATNTAGNTITLTMSEPVTDNSPTAGDFTVSGAASNPTVSSITVSDTTVTLTLTGGAISSTDSATVSYTKTTGSIDDAAGNLLADFASTSVIIDTTAPTVTAAATNPTGDAITLTLSEPVTDNSATASEFTVSGAASNPTVSSITVSGTTVTLTLTGGTIAAGETVTVSYAQSSGSIDDIAANPLASFTDTAVTNNVDGTAPTVSSAATNAAGSTITLTMSEPVTDNSATASEFTVSGAASNPTVSSITVSGSTVTLTLTGGTIAAGETVTVSYAQSSGSIDDAAGNQLADFASTSVTIDSTAPTVSSAATNAAGTTITLTISESVTDNSATASEFTVSGAASNPTVSTITVSGTTVTLTLTGGTIAAGETVTVSYAQSSGSIDDIAANPLASFTDTAVTNNVDGTAPTVSSAATNAAGTTITLTISESVTDNSATASEFTVSGAASNPTVSTITVSGNTVTLTLTGGTITAGETVTVSYAKNTGSIDDAAGNQLASFTNTAVTNSVPDTTAPTVSSAATNFAGTTITLTMSEPVTDSSATYANFAVSGTTSPLTVSSITVSGSTVTLTLTGGTVVAGDTPTISYTRTTGNINDASGNPLASFTGTAVTNNVRDATTTPSVPSAATSTVSSGGGRGSYSQSVAPVMIQYDMCGSNTDVSMIFYLADSKLDNGDVIVNFYADGKRISGLMDTGFDASEMISGGNPNGFTYYKYDAELPHAAEKFFGTIIERDDGGSFLAHLADLQGMSCSGYEEPFPPKHGALLTP